VFAAFSITELDSTVRVWNCFSGRTKMKSIVSVAEHAADLEKSSLEDGISFSATHEFCGRSKSASIEREKSALVRSFRLNFDGIKFQTLELQQFRKTQTTL
jgi:hypothetical protein